MQIAYVTFEDLGLEGGPYARMSDWIEHTAPFWDIDVVSRTISAELRFRPRIREYYSLPIGPEDELGSWLHRPDKLFELAALLRQVGAYVRSADIVYNDIIFANFYSLTVPSRQCLITEINGVIGEELVNKGSVARGSLKHRLFRLLERLAYHRADHLVAVSRGIREYVVQEFGIPADKVDVVTNGVDLEQFHVDGNGYGPGLGIRQLYVLGDCPLLFFHGFFQSWHCLEELVRCFRLVKDEIPDARLMLVGDGPVRGAVEQVVHETDLTDSVVFAGAQPKRDIPSYLAAADVCAYYSSYEVGRYGFLGNPIKLYEYMAMQKPVVTSRLRGFSELIEESECGLVTSRAYEDFARGVIALLKDKERSYALGCNGRRVIESAYSWSVIGKRVYDLCTEALERKRARAASSRAGPKQGTRDLTFDRHQRSSR